MLVAKTTGGNEFFLPFLLNLVYIVYMVTNRQKKITILLCLLGTAILLLLYLKNTRQQNEDTEQIPQPPILMIDRLLGDSGWEDTKTYTNTMYGYSIQYPGRYLDPSEVESPRNVAITWNDLARTMEWTSYLSFGYIDIIVWINYLNLSLFEESKKSMAINRTFIGTTKIAGYDGLVFTENPSSYPPDFLDGYCKDNRVAVFEKGNMFFLVRTCTINHERVWASFKFK